MNSNTAEIETANLLLQLSTSQSSLDIAYDNADLLPVDAVRKEDFTHELREKEEASAVNDGSKHKENLKKKSVGSKVDSDTDSDKTVDYGNESTPMAKNLNSPKGKLS